MTVKQFVLLIPFTILVSCSNPQQPKQQSEAVSPPPIYFQVNPKTAAVVAGKIMFAGRKPARQKIDVGEDPQCSAMHKSGVYDQSLVVNSNGTLSNVFVYVKAGFEGNVFKIPSAPVTIDQKGCWFEPRVLGIQTGQILRTTNSDPVTHNIHPQAQVNRPWNQSQSEGAPPLQRRFSKPEIMIPVKCNIHSWMHAWIGVVDSPYFAVTHADGSFEIANIPPGKYTIAAWQEKLGSQEQQVTIAPSSHGVVNFSFKGE